MASGGSATSNRVLSTSVAPTQRHVPRSMEPHSPLLHHFESLRSCTQVCLSFPPVWAWLQGNSRARRLYSAVPARAGFGFPRTLPASPFQEHKQCAPDPPKNCFAWLESGPLRSGSPQPIGAGKERNMLCKNRITLIGFVGQDAETRTTPNGNQYTRFSVATSVSRKDNSNGEYKTRTEWHRVICWNKLADWLAICTKVLMWRSKASYGTVNTRPLSPTEV